MNATRFHHLVKMAAMLLLLLLATAKVRAQSALDGFDPNADGEIGVVVVQPDGKILIGGSFTHLSPNGGVEVARNHIARLNPDGTLDSGFNPNANESVSAIAVQADGKILVGGFFTSIGGQTRWYIARLDATTGLADSFDPHASFFVFSIVVQADGKILVGGDFASIAGPGRNNIARLNTDGTLDMVFNPNANFPVESIAVQADGKILAAGHFTSIGGQTRNYIARLNPTTGLADSFDPNANDSIFAIAVQADGKILVGGYFHGANSIGGQARNYIARLDSTTGLADSFDPNANDSIGVIAVQGDGKILAGGDFGTIGGQARGAIARLDAASGLADSFDPNASKGGHVGVVSIAVQADGKILAGGAFTTLAPNGGAPVTRNRIARLETDGRLDQTLDLVTVGTVLATTVQRDGKILVGGSFTTILGVVRNNMARLNTDGTLDMAFNPNANNSVESIAVQADGKIIVGGNFNGTNSIGGQTRNYIARLEAETGLADSFDPNAINPFGLATVYSIAVQADGKILAAGSFSNIGGQSRSLLARLDATTGLADSFDPNPNSFVYSIALQADGKIVAGGAFNQIGQRIRNHIARLDAATGMADSFDPNPNGFVYSSAVQADGKILVGGNFLGVSSIGGQTRNRIARLDPATGLADSFDPNANGLVHSIALQADGKVLAGGAFNGTSGIGGQARNFIARLDPTTGLADSFDPHANAEVHSIALQADGKILLGGQFDTIGAQMRNGFARLSNDIASLQNLAVSRTDITWTLGGSSPQFTRVTFESSTDNLNYVPLGNGAASGSTWSLTGLSLPTGHLKVRARGYYRSGYLNGSESITESVRSVFLTPTRLANISTRLRVGTGDDAVIGGFIITGTEPKTVIVRGIGPSLPVPGALADPVIEVHGSSGELLATNDNWRDGLYAKQVANTLPPANDLESALWGILDPGPYTVVVRGKNDTTGIALFEVYDLDQTVNSKLANISTRGFVEATANVLIGGTIIIGNDPTRVLLRAIGPSLTSFGVPNALQDPTLELHDSNGALLASNDNWRSDQETEIFATGIPPSNDLESAIVGDLAPGNYTAIVRGSTNTAGIALVEAYELN